MALWTTFMVLEPLYSIVIVWKIDKCTSSSFLFKVTLREDKSRKERLFHLLKIYLTLCDEVECTLIP